MGLQRSDRFGEVRVVPGLHYMGYFENGNAVGKFWIQMTGHAFLHGNVDDNGLISGDKIAFIYQDGETALYGQFKDREMIKAYHANVENYACDENGLFFAEKFSDKKSEQIYKFEMPSNNSFGGGGRHPDPFETKFLKLGQSSCK